MFYSFHYFLNENVSCIYFVSNKQFVSQAKKNLNIQFVNDRLQNRWDVKAVDIRSISGLGRILRHSVGPPPDLLRPLSTSQPSVGSSHRHQIHGLRRWRFFRLKRCYIYFNLTWKFETEKNCIEETCLYISYVHDCNLYSSFLDLGFFKPVNITTLNRQPEQVHIALGGKRLKRFFQFLKLIWF